MSKSFDRLSFDRHLKERGWVEPKDLPKGPGGYPLCRQCGTETAPPRRTFCSAACVNSWKIRSQPGYAREQVFGRDKGICKDCGLDTEELKRLLYRVKMERGHAAYVELTVLYETQYGYGFYLGQHTWECDHDLAVALGGGSCNLSNLVTRCLPCHHRKTQQDLKKIRARRKSPTKSYSKS